jgi:GNAT superfamily N-acetyltransferase
VGTGPLPPEPLSPRHRTDAFDCGEPALDDWLRRRALPNQASGASRTFVVADTGGRVLGYYALAAGAVARASAGRQLRRNMPDPLPVVVLARLAVDRTAQSQGIGAGLLQDAVKRALSVAGNAGVRAVLVHALNDEAAGFYRRYGFRPSAINPRVLLLPLPGRE